MINKILFLSVYVVLFAACSNDDSHLSGNPVEVRFTSDAGTIRTLSTAAVTGKETYWETSDRIGIYMMPHSEAITSAGYTNVEYMPSTGNAASSALVPVGDRIYYSPSGTVDFIAYYPRQGTVTGYKIPVNVSTQSAATDVLYSDNATGYSHSSSMVNLQFRHVLAKLRMTFVAGEGFADLDGLTAQVQNITTGATLDLADGTLTSGSVRGNINVPANNEVILIPGQYNAMGQEGRVKFTVSGDEYYWDISGIDFQSSMLYSYTITINRRGLIVTVTPGDATWDYDDTNDIPAQPDL
jgi:hypothetical protein